MCVLTFDTCHRLCQLFYEAFATVLMKMYSPSHSCERELKPKQSRRFIRLSVCGWAAIVIQMFCFTIASTHLVTRTSSALKLSDRCLAGDSCGIIKALVLVALRGLHSGSKMNKCHQPMMATFDILAVGKMCGHILKELLGRSIFPLRQVNEYTFCFITLFCDINTLISLTSLLIV